MSLSTADWDNKSPSLWKNVTLLVIYWLCLSLLSVGIDLLTLFTSNSIEILMLRVCKCQKWQEQCKVDKYWNIKGLISKNCHTGEVLKPKNNRTLFLENSWEFVWERSWMGIDARSMQNFHIFSLFKFCVFENITSATVFNIKFPNFRYQLTLTVTVIYWHLQSANIRFKKREKGQCNKTVFSYLLMVPSIFYFLYVSI